jgi:nitroimidazol reductase NimA-like FMN-containing flavoprotein (pyridoxamine 5'-phosphate oxidase superfamily)
MNAILEARHMSVKSWQILDGVECWALLKARHLGRLGFVDQDGPIVLPINYAVVNDVIIFRTDAGSKLDAAVRGDRLAFEIDGFDVLEQAGWSVLVRGVAELVTDETELGLLRSMPLVSWAPGVKPIYVRLGEAEVTGRRITAPDLPAHWWG